MQGPLAVPMTHAPSSRRSAIARTRAMPAPARHACSAGMVGGMALLPLAGLPVVPQGQPFLLVLAILAVALLFGRATAVVAALVAAAAGAALLLPSAGAAEVDAVRSGLSVVAFLIVALGLASAVEAMRRVFALMDVADGRRALGNAVPVPVMARPGAARLLLMTPEQRRARFDGRR
jgi:K+-sensing histidine kinase KdpD